MEVAKKLDFLESVPLEVGNAHEPTAYKEYLGAFAELQRLLEGSCGRVSNHIEKTMNRAYDTACGAGDLRRLRRQFSSLKNTYVLYDVKAGFIDESDTVGNGSGLRSGLPDGTEQATLQEVEKELEVVSNSVKSLKSENQKAEERVLHEATILASKCNEVLEEQAKAATSLSEVAVELRARAAQEADLKRDELDHEVAHLSDLTKEARDLEHRIAACQAEAAELQAALTSEEEHILALKYEMRREARQSSSQVDEEEKTDCTWCQQLSQLLGVLTGVEVVNVLDNTIELSIQGPGNAAHLLLQFTEDAHLLQHARLLNSDVDIQDIANEIGSGHRPLTFAIREISARINQSRTKI